MKNSVNYNKKQILLVYPKISFSNSNHIQNVLSSNELINTFVNDKINKYHLINFDNTMKSLVSVVRLLQCGYAGSREFKFSVINLNILSEYQSLIHNSYSASNDFVQTCLKALNYHSTALLLAENDKIESSLEIIAECSKLAGKMEDRSGLLAKEVKKLLDLSKTALEATQNVEIDQRNKQDESDKQKNEKAYKKKVSETKINNVKDNIQDLREKEKKIEQERSQKSIFGYFTGWLFGSSEQNKQNEKYEILKTEIMNKCAELKKEEQSLNADITKLLCEFNNLEAESQKVEKSILSLEISVKALGKVKTAFENTQLFWNLVKSDCEMLKDMVLFKSLSQNLKGEFINEIKKSGFDWLSLGQINLLANSAFLTATKDVDQIMNNLPTKSEADQILKTSADEILALVNGTDTIKTN